MLGDLPVITYVRRDNSHHYDSRSLPCWWIYVGGSASNYLCKERQLSPIMTVQTYLAGGSMLGDLPVTGCSNVVRLLL